MTRSLLALALALGALSSSEAQRPIKTLEGAYEVDLASVVVPIVPTGAVSLKPCAECDTVSHALAPSTRYVLSGTEVAFDEFVAAVSAKRRASGGLSTLMVVLYDKETTKVTRLLMSAPR